MDVRHVNNQLLWLRDHSPSDFILLDAAMHDVFLGRMRESHFNAMLRDAILLTEREYELMRHELAEAGLM